MSLGAAHLHQRGSLAIRAVWVLLGSRQEMQGASEGLR